MTSLITTVPGSAVGWTRAARLGTSPTIESRSATDRPAQVRDDHPAGVDSDAHLGGPPNCRPSSAWASRIARRVEAGEDGAAGVVLVRFGVAEAARMPSPRYWTTEPRTG